MDAATRATVIDILRKDAAEGITGDTVTCDQNAALRLWQDEVDTYSTADSEYKMAISIARAMQTDRNLVSAAAAEEHALQTTDAWHFVSQGHPGPNRHRVPRKKQRVEVAPAPRVIVRVDCVACTEATPETEVVKATPGSDNYCRTCVTKLFDDSLRDETLFPPRCCRTHIPIELVQRFFAPGFTARFEKAVEIRDPRRTYCATQTCSKYLRAENTGRSSLAPASRYCGSCSLWTCEQCKKSHNPGSPCPKDEEVLRMGKQQGWKMCARCKNLVELSMGCNHMTCRCKYEFCYACAAPWKTCDCELFEERQLLTNQNQNQNRRARCQHDARWRRIPGGRRGDDCRVFMPQFTMQCIGCNWRACVRCRYNRQ